jgi:hypothetical protein
MAAKKPVQSKPNPKKIVARFLLEAMSNLPPVDTGVADAVIWVSSGEFVGTKSQHGPRVKIIPGTKITKEGLSDAASVTITKPPRVIGTLPGKLKKQVIDFVNLNRVILLQYWRNEISTRQMLDGLVKL